MSRTTMFSFLTLFCCVSSVCFSDELDVNSLIHGTNQAAVQIQSGEVQFSVTVVDHADKMSEEEAVEFMQEEKEKGLKAFVEDGPDPFYPEVGLKEYEEVYLEEQVAYLAKRYRERTEIENSVIAFQRLSDDTLYKVASEVRPGLSLDSRDAQHGRASQFYLRVYDTQIQVKEDIGDNLGRAPLPSVEISSSDSYFISLDFALFGRSNVSANAQMVGREFVNGTECHVLMSRSDNVQNKIWIDVSKDFCIHRVEFRKVSNSFPFYLKEFEEFQAFGDILYPKEIRITEFDYEDGTLRRTTRIKVTSAEFNVDFPEDFFAVNPELYGRVGDTRVPQFGQLPIMPQTHGEYELLLCGPQSLLRVCEILKVESNLEELKQLTGFDPNRGTTMLGLRDGANYKGLTSKGVKSNLEAVQEKKVPLPAIAYVNGDHFLVLEAVQGDGVRISDSASKYAPYLSWEELSKIWEGELLIFDAAKQSSLREHAPLALVPESVYDFGEALGGSEIRHKFTIQNIGQQPLSILSMTETCACTATMVSQRDIPAGANATIEAVLKIPSENTLVEESISVFTNDPTQNTVVLTFKGRAFVPLKTFPERLAFGNQKLVQSPLTKRISLHLRSEVEILGVRTDSEHLRAKLSVGQLPHVELQLLPTMPIGQFSHRLLVDYRYGGKETTHDVSVFGEVLGAFRVTPKQFFFGMVKSAETVSKTATISSIDDKPFKILSVEPSVQELVANTTKSTNGASYRITTTIDSKLRPGELSGEVVIETNCTLQSTIRIPFFGIIGE